VVHSAGQPYHLLKLSFSLQNWLHLVMAILSTPFQYLAAIPPVTRAWTAATIVSTLFYFWVVYKTHSDYAPYITLVPGSSVFYPWTFLSSALVETSIIEVCTTVASPLIAKADKIIVLCYTYCDTRIVTVFGTALGNHRNNQIHGGVNRDVKHNRVCIQLDRIHCDKERRPLPVRATSTLSFHLPIWFRFSVMGCNIMARCHC